ncbi:alkaline phosphatase family protein [Microvirga terricola]|uniref:Acid phosphatase n=1 Tax=Microvirga terricola TaxID=2719797 RepID=A0ABX0VCZ9_9HYPH|nr:alkaline phosphatase family protein [Microvirga terricola]NIX77321.1 acid phosphatase [Microvirga terricola]
MRIRLSLLGAAVCACTTMANPSFAQSPQGLEKLSHILVLYLENRSFDNMFGEFPGANGIADAGEGAIQRKRDGQPFSTLPVAKKPFNLPENPSELREIEALGDLPNEPFAIDGIRPGVTTSTYTRDLTHSFYTHRSQIHGGQNDLFALYSDAGALTMGHYSAAALKDSHLWQLAGRYTLLDNFFQGAFGGSFLNHIWLVCACAPVWPNPRKELRSEVDEHGNVVRERKVSAASDGDYALNTTQSELFNNGKQGKDLLPPQTAPTIGDRLSEKEIDWAWYAGGWNLAIRDRTTEEDEQLTDLVFQWHHQPFASFARFDPTNVAGRHERDKHLKDATQLEEDIKAGTLPPVAFYKPIGVLNQHPDYASLDAADEEVARIVRLLEDSPMRDSYALIITYDEYGGFFDHVAPPEIGADGEKADFFGPGSRVPTIVVSPFARKGVIDHTPYDTTSILKLIGERHHLAPLPSPRYGAVESLAKAFDFDR